MGCDFRHCFGGLVGSSWPEMLANLDSCRHWCQAGRNINQIVCDHAQSNPALHSGKAAIQTPAQSMSPFQRADPSFTTGPPLLPSPEPTTLLYMAPLFTACVSVRHRDTLDTHLLQRLLVGCGIKSRICRDHLGRLA